MDELGTTLNEGFVIGADPGRLLFVRLNARIHSDTDPPVRDDVRALPAAYLTVATQRAPGGMRQAPSPIYLC